MSGKEPKPHMALVESPQMVSTVKLPILKKVIMNGDEPVQTTKDENGVETKVPPKTTQALLQRQKERKAKSILLLAILDEYQLRFHTIKDAKSLWAAIKNRFGGNVESKKMQKNVLKQQFEKIYVSDTEGLDKAYDRFQKLISQLEIHDIDDLYNNLKVFEADIKGSSRSSSNSQNVAFLSVEDTNSINEVNTANGVSTAAGHSSQGQVSSSSYTNDLMLSFFSDQSSGFDKAKVECFNYHRRGHFVRECRAPRNQGYRNGDAGYRSMDNTRRTVPVETSDALVVQDNALIMKDGLGYVWSYIAQDEPTELALMAYTSNSSGSDTELGLESIEAQLVVHQKNEVVYEEKIAVLEFKVKDKVPPPLTGNYMPPLANLSFVGLDDSVYTPTTNKTSASMSQVETSDTPPSNTSVEIPRVESVRPSGVIIEDWISDDDEDIFQSNDLQTIVKPSFKKIKFTKARNEPVKTDKQAVKPRMVTQSPKVNRKDWNGKMTQKL
ncbi:ribonuclease H-like domain-containing protein, partial [Tanacetum coccineum]